MSNKFKDVDIKIKMYYFLGDIINIKSFDPNKTKLDKRMKSHTKIFLFTTLNMLRSKIRTT